MLCEVCKENDVAVTLTEIDGTDVRQVRLCEQCAAARGVQTAAAAPAAAVSTFLQSVQQQAAAAGVGSDAVRCSFCGATFRDFRQTGRLGCAACYRTFEAPLRDLLRKVQGNARHVGRRYDGNVRDATESRPDPAVAAERIRERLARAVRNEQFELAATLRDQLRALE